MCSRIVLIIGFVCLLQQVASATPAGEDEEQNLDLCLREANEKFEALDVPEKVKELQAMAADNDLDELYLLDIVGSSKDNMKKVERVFKSVAGQADYEKSCLAFDESTMALMRSFSCEQKLREFSSVNALNNRNILGPNNAVSKVNRYRMACIMMKLSA